MNLNAHVALRQVEEPRWEISSAARLEYIAALVFGVEWAEEDEAREVICAGQELQALADLAPLCADIGFFLIAWGAEKIAASRIGSGDLGIDDTLRRIAEHGRGSPEWQEAMAEYQRLAEEILIDTLNEFREFGVVVLYSGRRDLYARRRAAGMAQLGQFLPGLAADRQPVTLLPAHSAQTPAPLALAG